MNLVEIGHDLTETIIGRSKATTIRGIYLALADAAERRYGREGQGWRKRKESTLLGWYAVASDGRCLVARHA